MSEQLEGQASSTGLSALAAGGAVWSVGGLLVAEPIRIAFTALLARILDPSDFGLLGIATIFVGLMTIGNELGLQASIIQRPFLDDDELNSLFWFNLGVGLLFAITTASISSVVAFAFGEPTAGPLIAALGVGFVVVSLVQVQNALVRRAFDFRVPALANIGAVVVGGLAALWCANAGFGVWSLVVNSLVASTTSAVIVQSRVRYRPRFHFEWSEVRGFVHLGSRLMASDLMQYGAGTVDNAVVGYMLGPAALGPYGLAYNLITYPARRISAVLAASVFPAFARVQDDRSRLRSGLERSVAVSSVVVLPLTAAAAVAGRSLIIGLYGGQWNDAVLPFQALCLAAAGRSVAVHAENVFKALGRGSAVALWSLFGLLGIGSAAIVGLQWGLIGVAVAVAVSTAAVSLAQLIHASHLAGVPGLSALRLLVAPLLLSAGSALVSLGVSRWLAWAPDLVTALSSVLAGSCVALLLGWRTRAVRDLASLVKGIVRRHRAIENRDTAGGKRARE